MMRKLAVALSLVSVLGAGVVQALGLGEASVESTLNQPLKAEIELVNIRDLEDNEILPGLASREEFLKAGVERIYFLSDVRFEVQRNESGNMVVQLTTTKPVREPFLNFLVEVIWPSGRLLREYALLIDPPIYGEEPIAPVQQVQSAPTQSVSSLPEIEVVDDASSVQQAYTPVSRSSASSQQRGDVYGPTTNNDTMWAIALEVRPDSSVTAQQTMLAIQDLNPDSFINGNINTLKKGQVLRLPSLNDIRQRSKRDAVRGVIAQNRAFENRTLNKNVVDASPSTEDSGVAASGMPTSSAVNTGDELKLVVAEKSSSENQAGAHAGEVGSEGASDALKNDLAITLEKLDQAGLEKQELNSKVQDLEEQLETLQRLLTLKDDQLANLQTQMGKEDAVEPAVSTTVDESTVAEDSVVEENMAAVDALKDGTVTDEAVKDGAVNDEAVATESDLAESDASVEGAAAIKPASTETAGMAPVAGTAKPDAAVKPKAKPAPVAPAEEKFTIQSVVDLVMNNPMYQMMAAGLVLLLLIIVWAMSRRNAQKEQEFFETRNEQGEEPGDIFDADETLGADELDDTLVDLEGRDAADTDAVHQAPQSETEDVIAEADIYIAYGRLDQAAQLLEGAISSEPQRTDIRIKLLEVYAESNEVESFDKQFNEVAALNDDYAMEQAQEIRSRLSGSDEAVSLDDLESQLLSGSDEAAEVEELPGDTGSSDEKDDDYSIDFEPTKIETPESDTIDGELNVDEELSALETDLAADGVLQDAALDVEDDLDIDFNIDEIDLDGDDVSIEDADSAALDLDELSVDTPLDDSVTTDEEVSFDLDLGLDESADLASTQSSDEDGLDIDLESMELDAELDEALAGVDTDLDDIALDLDESDSDDAEDLDIAVEDLEDGLNLDDLDLELDKIDSELDDNFDDVESSDSPEVTSEESEPLTSESALEELEGIADTLSSDDDLAAEDDLGLDESLALDESLDLDDALEIEESLEIDESLELDEDLELDENLASVDVDKADDKLAEDTIDTSLDIDDSVLDIAAGADASGEDFEADIAEDEDFDFLAGTDEAATKLDLARAYIDMGDGDGAKDILEEVALEGSDEQKQEAQDLLKTLD
ncbi:FimV/HubP family polar landmark protein [Alkalimarinus alittae]|uniref:FimV N-terminal domain-containing protein n=1 Tax=Alkalimarinus alittae TaxID=2961619 RepID=A0ABY6N6V7_9ALTE|nr:FimV/HubP family polar landmark protein [Alkalimarinus alittae]UZE97853.1 hypothetical protein NKI27_08995 [Alkalimarinus alittae]